MSSHDKNHKQDNRPTAQKYWKIVLLLIAAATLQWIFRPNTNLSSVSSFIRSSSSSKSTSVGGDDSGNNNDYDSYSDHHHRHDPKQEIVVEAATTSEEPTTILLIHYHKTGNNFVVDLLKQIHRTFDQHNLTMKEPSVLKRMMNNKKGHLQRGQEKHAIQMIGGHDDILDDDEFEDSPADSSTGGNNDGNNNKNNNKEGNETKGILRKRSHDPTTGCPILGDTEFEVGAAYRLVAPNLFCNLSMTAVVGNAADDIEHTAALKSTSEGTPPASDHHYGRQTKLVFPAWKTTKIVHFVRDPIDMALSNYLYHSQHPTPEPWIKRKGINPCKTDEEFMKYTLDELNNNVNDDDGASTTRSTIHKKKKKITVEDLLQVSTMCRYYKYDHDIAKKKSNNSNNNETRRSFYGIMRRLPPYDGLRFATSHFLMAQTVESGGDLLRMPNNILRLLEWDETGGAAAAAAAESSHILTMSMGKIVKDMEKSILEICDFIFGHISNVTFRSEIADAIAHKMVARYQAKTKASKIIHAGSTTTNRQKEEETTTTDLASFENNNKNWTLRQQSHVTQGIMNNTERQALKKQLEEDSLLGHILLQIREIVNDKSSV